MDFAKLIEFLQAYPGWMKGAIALWIVAGAILAGGLVVLRPAPKTLTPPTAQTPAVIGSPASSSVATTSLSVGEIVSAVNNAPPLQRNEVARNYVGIAIEWTGYLRSAEEDFRDPKRVRVNLAVNKEDIVGNSFWFSIARGEIPELKVLHKNSKFSVRGQIISVSGPGLSVDVEPTEVKVLERVM